MLPYIEIGYPVFLRDGADAFGAVRDIVPDGRPVLVVNIENAGDVEIPIDAIEKVVAKRVVVRHDHLDERLLGAIAHALDREDFPPSGEEVELEPASTDDEEDDGRRIYDGPRVHSPPDELPGRDAGSRYFRPAAARASLAHVRRHKEGPEPHAVHPPSRRPGGK